MNKLMEIWKKSWILGIIVGSVTYTISYLLTFLGLAPTTVKLGNYVTVTGALVDVNLRSQIVSSGVANQLGLTVMKYLRYVPKWDWGQYIIIVLGSIALVMIGKGVYSLRGVPKGSARFRLATQLFYGALLVTAITALLGGMLMSMAFINLAITMALYYLAVAIIVIAIDRYNVLWLSKFIKE